MNRLELIEKISSDLETCHDFKMIYLGKHGQPPKGVPVQTTPGGARYYESSRLRRAGQHIRQKVSDVMSDIGEPAGNPYRNPKPPVEEVNPNLVPYIEDIDRLIMKHEKLHAKQSFWREGFLDALYDIKESLLQRSSEGSDKQHYAHIRSLLETAKNRYSTTDGGDSDKYQQGYKKAIYQHLIRSGQMPV